MRLQFTKMHGLGNDFVVFDAIHQQVELTPAQVRFIADRRRGIGCDQVLLVERATRPDADFRYRIFNADGGEVEQCGNGARCFARFVRDHGLIDRDRIRVETRGGLIELQIQADGQVRVDMGPPRLDPADIPFQAPTRAARYALEVEGEALQIGALSMGNPHAVLQVEDVDTAPVARLGPLIEHHPRFPQRVNVGFMQVLDPGHIRLRVHERGAGETEACGTGACAAVVAGRLQGLLDEQVEVELPGGDLVISWAGDAAPVYMTGPAVSVFEGSIEL
ncbi:diaminopimelate epimerase [Thiohalobacter sp. IOR34]|uniref:diaminopimelate epimerase n=1 Tax=Thiohalobacter sp. IOR34 TaxID=3057176 RepID=UPI0025B042A9|nr:diaminopimelate epimerase [Thiohalobacter sp. IOR34]WJW75579.1 diaminopimelate epimerase [Thiohalobacter sp. IOR34]